MGAGTDNSHDFTMNGRSTGYNRADWEAALPPWPLPIARSADSWPISVSCIANLECARLSTAMGV